MNAQPSGNVGKLSTSLCVLAGSLPLAAFLYKATPILIATVAAALLEFVTALVMLIILLSAAAIVYICVKWLWHMAEDDRYTRRYQRQMLDLDLVERRLEVEERKLEIEERRLQIEERKQLVRPLPTRASRTTDASIPVVMRQQRPVTRRLNVQRPDH